MKGKKKLFAGTNEMSEQLKAQYLLFCYCQLNGNFNKKKWGNFYKKQLTIFGLHSWPFIFNLFSYNNILLRRINFTGMFFLSFFLRTRYRIGSAIDLFKICNRFIRDQRKGLKVSEFTESNGISLKQWNSMAIRD